MDLIAAHGRLFTRPRAVIARRRKLPAARSHRGWRRMTGCEACAQADAALP